MGKLFSFALSTGGGGGGSIDGSGSPNQIAVFSGATTIGGSANFTWDGSTLAVTGTVAITGGATISTTLGVTGNQTIGGTLVVTGTARFNGGVGINAVPTTTNIANFILNQNASTRMYLGNTTVGGSADTRFVMESSTDVCSFVVDSAATFLSGSAFSGLNFNQSGAKSINFRTNSTVRLSIDGTGNVNVASLTASQAVFTDGSKNLISNAITGTGNVVMSAGPTLTGTITAAAANFSGAVTVSSSLKSGNYHIEPGETNIGNSSTSFAVDWSANSAQLVTMTGNVTSVTFSNPQTAGTYVLRIATGAGSFTATGWPAAVKWVGGTAPTLTTTASKQDVITFYYNGTDYLGSYTQNY